MGLNLISFDDLQFKQGGRAAKTDTQFTCKKKKKGAKLVAVALETAQMTIPHQTNKL